MEGVQTVKIRFGKRDCHIAIAYFFQYHKKKFLCGKSVKPCVGIGTRFHMRKGRIFQNIYILFWLCKNNEDFSNSKAAVV